MTVLLIIALSALLAIVGIRLAVRGVAAEITRPEDLIERTHPVDLIAFRNVLSATDDQLLRASLPWSSFVRVRLARQRAAIEYVHTVANNAAVLLRLAQSAARSNEPPVKLAGRELLKIALQVRILSLMALVKLYVALLVPWWQPSLGVAASMYARLRTALQSVVLLQRPDLVTRITSGV